MPRARLFRRVHRVFLIILSSKAWQILANLGKSWQRVSVYAPTFYPYSRYLRLFELDTDIKMGSQYLPRFFRKTFLELSNPSIYFFSHFPCMFLILYGGPRRENKTSWLRVFQKSFSKKSWQANIYEDGLQTRGFSCQKKSWQRSWQSLKRAKTGHPVSKNSPPSI